ncbi:MAG: AI-2E family transporter [Planctomycetota bacterium]|nr:AI-2E family transporter [Planctomycetota bacterium]
MARYISFAVLLAIIAVIGVLFYKVMIGFFVPVFLAAVLVVVFRPLHRWVCSKVGEREHVAAGVTTTLIVLIVLVPTALVLTMAAVQGASLYRSLDSSSIKFSLAKLRSNSLLKLDFPIAKQVQEVQKKVSDIQVHVAKEQTFQDLISDKGLLRSDIKEIRNLLTELVPRLIESSRVELSDSIVQTRDKSKPKVPHAAQFDAQIIELFSQARDDIQSLLTAHESMSESEFRTEKERVKNQTDMMLSELTPSERTMSINARSALIESGVAWNNEIAAMDKLLVDCLPNDETTMSQLQRAVADLVSQWMRTRETIAGGPWRAALMDLANPTDEDIEAMNTGFFAYIRPRLLTFTGDSAAFLLKLLVSSSILLVSLYFFLYDGPSMVRTLMELSPLDDRYELELLAQFDRISRAIVLATVLSALLQGLVAGIGYYFAGMPSLILLTALTATCALVPFVGPAIVWVPVCLYLAIYE